MINRRKIYRSGVFLVLLFWGLFIQLLITTIFDSDLTALKLLLMSKLSDDNRNKHFAVRR